MNMNPAGPQADIPISYSQFVLKIILSWFLFFRYKWLILNHEESGSKEKLYIKEMTSDE